jgi:hypothetical protein
MIQTYDMGFQDTVVWDEARRGFSAEGLQVASLGNMRKKRNVVPVILDVIAFSASVARGVNDYYDGLSKDELAELSEWGDFALRQFPEEWE